MLVVFHGREPEGASHVSELEPRGLWMLVPLVFLAVPSLLIGWFTYQPVVLGEYFASSLVDLKGSASGAPDLGTGTLDFFVHGLYSPVFLLALIGGLSAWVLYEWRPGWRSRAAPVLRVPGRVLELGYGFDPALERAIIPGARGLARVAADQADARFIDGLLVNGLARTIRWGSGVMRRLQTGLLYHYAFAMVAAICLLIAWVILVLD